MAKKIPIKWLVETLDARLNPYADDSLNGVPRQVIDDLIVLGLLDESKIDFADDEPKQDIKAANG